MKTYKKPKAFLFDLDNTLIPTDALRQRLSEETIYIMTGHSWPGCCAGLLGMTQEQANTWLFENYKIDPLEFRKLRNPYEDKAIESGQIQLYHGAYDFIKSLECPWGIVTQSPRKKLDQLFNARIFKDLVPNVVITAEDTERNKPFPDPYLLACKKLYVAPSNVFVLEDNKKGIDSALQAGCMVGQFDSGFDDIWQDLYFTSYAELSKFFMR